MDSSQDNELESENSLSSSPRPLRKNITIKLKSDKSSSSRGRPRKSSKSAKKEDQDPHSADDEVLDTPIFKTMEPGEPLHHNKKLRWDHKVNLIGEKVVDPLIHCCEKCSLPILIYGRMIQCKHVFCFTCAKKTEKSCPRCGDPVQRIEQSALGTVFLCTYGGSKHGNNGCRRTYLSQRDLNAHIGHRHLKTEVLEQSGKGQGSTGAQRTSVSIQPPKPASSTQVQSGHQTLGILEQFTAAVRQASASVAVSVASMPQRSSQEDLYQQHGQISHPTQPQHLTMSSAHQMMQPHQGALGYPPVGSAMQSMPPLSVSQPMMGQSSVVSVSTQDNFTSSIPVVGSRIKTLISVPIQEDTDYSKQQQPQQQPYQTLPPVNYPPPSIGQYPVVSMAPNIHQPPPGVPPPMFSSQSLPGPMQNPTYTAPMSQPMTGAMQHVPPPISAGQPRGPPRMSGPPSGPPRYFDQNQAPRGPWPAPPRAPPNQAPRPRGPPQADYNYY